MDPPQSNGWGTFAAVVIAIIVIALTLVVIYFSSDWFSSADSMNSSQILDAVASSAYSVPMAQVGSSIESPNSSALPTSSPITPPVIDGLIVLDSVAHPTI